MKNTILGLALILVFSSLVSAQKTLKMELNVMVRSGVTISFEDHQNVEYSGFSKEIASVYSSKNEIEFLTHPEIEIIMKQKELAELQNEFGENMIIFSKIEAIDIRNIGNTSLQISSSIDFEKTPRGTFKGDYYTSIEYL